MANAVTKDEVKAFVKDVRKEMDVRYAAKFVQNTTFNQVKGELNTLQDEVANMNPFTDEDKETLDKLAAADRELFNHQDVLDVFED